MFKLEFDPNNKELAGAIGRALTEYSGEAPRVQTVTETVGEVSRTVSAPVETTPEPVETTSEPVEDDAPVADEKHTDEHGTPHNPDYCVGVKSAKPFYTSGSNKGQWKKKPGVDESDYNEWYAATMPVQDEEEDDTPVNTAAAFGAKTEQPASNDAPKTSGELMKFITEQQTAGNLTQQQVTAAYGVAGVQINDLFNPAKEAEAAGKVYNAINQILAGNA